MKISDIIVISIKNIIRGRLRTVLTVLAIAIGIAAVILLTVIGQSGKKIINDKLEELGVKGIMVFSGDYDGLTLADGDTLTTRISEVSLTMPFETLIGCYGVHGTGSATAVILGVDENVTDFIDLNVLHGRLFNRNECAAGERVCVVERDFALKEFERLNIIGKTVWLTNEGVSDEYKIIGVVDSSISDITGLIGIKIPKFIYVPYTSLGYGEEDSIGQLAVKVSDNASAGAIRERVSSLLRKTNSNGKYFQVENISEYRSQFDYILNIVTLVLSFTASVSLIVAGIGIMNSMLATVNDRRAEIGICKAIGASRGQIAVIFLGEAIVLSAIGGLCGAAAGLSISLAAGGAVGFTPEISSSGILIPSAVTIMTGLVSGLMPALKAARLQPVAAIRND